MHEVDVLGLETENVERPVVVNAEQIRFADQQRYFLFNVGVADCRTLITSCKTTAIRSWHDQFVLRWFDVRGDATEHDLVEGPGKWIISCSKCLPTNTLLDSQ